MPDRNQRSKHKPIVTKVKSGHERSWFFGFTQNLVGGIFAILITGYVAGPFTGNWFSSKLSNVSDASVYFKQGYAYSKVKQYSKAIDEYKKALSLTPDNIGALNYLGYAYIQTNQLDHAISVLSRAVKLDGKNGWCRYNYALALAIKGDGAGLEIQIDKLQELDKEYGFTFIHTLRIDRTFTRLSIYGEFKDELLKKDITITGK